MARTIAKISNNEPPLNLLMEGDLEQAAECLKVMAHPIRLRMVDVLMQAELPVHKMAQLCRLSPHQTCEHLRLLKGHGLLGSRRKGRTVYYFVLHPRLSGLMNCIRRNCQTEAIAKP